MNGDSIRVIAKFKVHAGKERDFGELVAICKRHVAEFEPGTIQYDWFVSTDGRSVRVIEAYSNQSALEAHIDRGPPEAAGLLDIADLALEFLEPVPDVILKRLRGISIETLVPAS